MKYVALGILSILVSLNVCSQKVAGGATLPSQVTSRDKAIPDTIFHDFFDHSPVLYTAPVGGYLSGTNGYFDTEKGQQTKVTQTYIQTGLIYWFALKKKNTGGDTSSIVFNQYKRNGLQLIEGVTVPVPGTLQFTDTVALSAINADTVFSSGLNVFMFPQSVINFQDYVSTFSMELMNEKDTIALYNTTDSLVDISAHSWEKWNGKWNTILNAWELDIDFAIFPIVDMEGASVDENNISDVSIYPNPAADFVRVTLTQSQSESYVLLNANGQTIRKGNITNSSFEVDLQGLSSGAYIIGVYSGNGKDAAFYRIIKR